MVGILHWIETEDTSQWNDDDWVKVVAQFRHMFTCLSGYYKWNSEWQEINLNNWSDKAKLLLAGSIKQWDNLDSFTTEYPNLKSLLEVQPLTKKWCLSTSILPADGFKYYGVLV